MRIHGLADVPSVALDRDRAVAKPVLTAAQRRSRTVRRTLAARGFNECVSFSFIARDQATLFGGGDDGARRLSNPIAADLDALRPSLLPSLLAAASRNAARGFADFNLFEIGAARSKAACRKRRPPTPPASSLATACATGPSRAIPPTCSTPRRR